jgi:GTP-dependent dephospho-CoA kinase
MPTHTIEFETLILPQEKRIELKDPLGDLWIGDVETNLERLLNFLAHYKPVCLATVGDFVSYNILAADIHPDIVVVDHKIMRKSIDPIDFEREFVNVPNTPGTINSRAQSVLYQAAKECEHLAVIVDGEEDLLVLPLMAFMPNGSVIIYGQPREGMVVITLNDERRSWADNFMRKMHREQPLSDNP